LTKPSQLDEESNIFNVKVLVAAQKKHFQVNGNDQKDEASSNANRTPPCNRTTPFTTTATVKPARLTHHRSTKGSSYTSSTATGHKVSLERIVSKTIPFLEPRCADIQAVANVGTQDGARVNQRTLFAYAETTADGEHHPHRLTHECLARQCPA
jgi:hypothetical protein